MIISSKAELTKKEILSLIEFANVSPDICKHVTCKNCSFNLPDNRGRCFAEICVDLLAENGVYHDNNGVYNFEKYMNKPEE